jgi:hypothetical protein
MDTSSVLSTLAPLSQSPIQELPDASRAQVTKFEADQSALTMQNSIAKGLSSLVTNLSRNITG